MNNTKTNFGISEIFPLTVGSKTCQNNQAQSIAFKNLEFQTRFDCLLAVTLTNTAKLYIQIKLNKIGEKIWSKSNNLTKLSNSNSLSKTIVDQF